MKQITLFKALAVATVGLLLFSCIKPKVTELEVSPQTMSFEAQGVAEQTITVTANDEWTITGAPDWLTVTPTSGNGNATVSIKANDYDGFVLRDAEITVTCLELSCAVKVTQLAVTPSLAVDLKEATVDYKGGGVNLKITSNAPWTITSDVDWVTANPSSGTGNADVVLSVAPNMERAGRDAAITVTENVSGATIIFYVTQGEAPASRYSDSLALVAIYNASKGDSWTKGKWDLTKEISTWTGVKLDDANRVCELKLTTTVAIPEEWTLPDDISSLTELVDLRINKQKLTGNIPEAIYDLGKLQTLYLQGNLFTGPLSPSVGKLTELTQLYIDQNATMTGSIPKEIGQLKKLQRINISQSGIGGEIPVELGQCESLLQFMAFKSKLSGELPDIWDLPQLQTVMVHTCPGIVGKLPASLGKLKKIATAGPSIQAYDCNIEGNIPESFATLDGGEKKVQVQIQQNKMTGVVPSVVKAHKDFSSWKINPQQEGYGLEVDSTPTIMFKDVMVKQLCVQNWDTNRDGELSVQEAAAVTTIGVVFKGTSITSFDELIYFTEIIRIDNRAFEGCGNLRSISIPESVTGIGERSFYGCVSLQSVNLPQTLISINNRAFQGCSSLKSITIPSGVATLGDAVLAQCPNLQSIRGKYASADSRLLINNGEVKAFASSGLTSYSIPSAVTGIGAMAFAYCSELQAVVIPPGVTSIGSSAFAHCSSLTSIECKAIVPPVGSDKMFDNTNDCPIYVPSASLNSYKIASYWNYYVARIMGKD